MKVIAFARTEQGSGASRRLRTAGHTPAIVYGGSTGPVAIKLDHNFIFHALKKEAFHGAILDLEIDGKAEKVLLRDFQVHAYKQLVMHVDFQRVDPTQKIHVKVPLHFLNAETSPAVKLSAAVVSHIALDLEISCLPKDLPEFIAIDLANLEAGHSVHLKDITLPAGVTAVHAEQNPTIVTAMIPGGAAAAAAEEEAK